MPWSTDTIIISFSPSLSSAVCCVVLFSWLLTSQAQITVTFKSSRKESVSSLSLKQKPWDLLWWGLGGLEGVWAKLCGQEDAVPWLAWPVFHDPPLTWGWCLSTWPNIWTESGVPVIPQKANPRVITRSGVIGCRETNKRRVLRNCFWTSMFILKTFLTFLISNFLIIKIYLLLRISEHMGSLCYSETCGFARFSSCWKLQNLIPDIKQLSFFLGKQVNWLVYMMCLDQPSFFSLQSSFSN